MLTTILQALVMVLGTWLLVNGVIRLYEVIFKPVRFESPSDYRTIIPLIIAAIVIVLGAYILVPSGEHFAEFGFFAGALSLIGTWRIVLGFWALRKTNPLQEEAILPQSKTLLISGRLSHR